jgi:hypothetical protein
VILFEQFKNVLIVILLVATALSAFLGHGFESIAIAVIVLFAVLLGFVQQYRAERAIEALRHMAASPGSVGALLEQALSFGVRFFGQCHPAASWLDAALRTKDDCFVRSMCILDV